jgi:hypothetical protein
VIFELPSTVTAKKFAADNAFKYSYVYHLPSRDVTMNQQAWAINTEDVIDAVACSSPSKFIALPFSPQLDINYIHGGQSNDDKYGHSVKRRIEYTAEDGRIVLLDTNDSFTDFIATAPNPSPGRVDDAK